jgi:phage tail sheath protein FI
MAGLYKTPGVYIVEKDAFPSSIVEVATAVPAFIGYTEFANNNGKSLHNKPWRISSMAEFVKYFGGPPPATFKISRRASGAPDGAPAADEATQALRDAVAAITAQDKSPDFFGGAEHDFALDLNNNFYLTLDGQYFLLYRSMMLFFQNGGGPCYIVSVGNYQSEIKEADLGLGIEQLKKEQEPTLLVIPEAVALAEDDCFKLQQTMFSHCGYEMKNRFAIIDVYSGFQDNRDNQCIDNFRNKFSSNFAAFGAVYYPWVNASVVPLSELSFRNIHSESIDDFVNLLTLDALNRYPAPKKQQSVIDEINKLKDLAQLNEADADQLHKTLNVILPLYSKILEGAQRKLNLLPPSAAMAGIYSMVDNARGVWKAPANVSLNAVVSPTVSISHEEQEDLNVNTAGKSINAIRSFIGEGTLVWGARTLDGNSLDWRYINVRRTMIMLEESVKLAIKAYVFEPNVSSTWVTLKSMISNFLTNIWKRGGLAGAVPEDAFSVHVGLGETMTPEDILEGMLRITVLVALSRPAEFIEITFQQQMQKS